MQPPRLADTAEQVISPSEEGLITMQKQLEELKYINEQCGNAVAHIDGQLIPQL